MSENLEVGLDPDITKQGEVVDSRVAIAAVEDRLPTTRLPPISPPPRVTVHPDTLQPPKPSWFRALLTTTSPPPAPLAVELLAVRRMVAIGCVLAACAFAIIALVFAFRPAPSLDTMQPVVAATVVLTRALLAIGAGALTYGLLRMAERLSSERAMVGVGVGGNTNQGEFLD